MEPLGTQHLITFVSDWRLSIAINKLFSIFNVTKKTIISGAANPMIINNNNKE